MLVGQISIWVQQTVQFTPLVLEQTPVQSNLLWGEFSAFSVPRTNHYNSAFFIPLGTHHWCVSRGSMEWEVYLTLQLITIRPNQTPTLDLLILSSTSCPLSYMWLLQVLVNVYPLRELDRRRVPFAGQKTPCAFCSGVVSAWCHLLRKSDVWPVDPLTFSKKNPSRAIPRSTYIHPRSLVKIRQRTSEE